jgi:hypothetical protein
VEPDWDLNGTVKKGKCVSPFELGRILNSLMSLKLNSCKKSYNTLSFMI